MSAERWSIDGEIIDTCNCDVICPCTMGSPASYGSCLGNVTWCIDEGFYGDVDLSGCIAQLAINAPGPYFDDGNWRVALYGHASATREQRESLEAIFLGQAGGFFGDWRDMMSEIVGVRWVPIQVERRGRKRVVRIDGVLDIDADAIVGPNEDETATLVNPPFWKGAPYPATLGRSERFTYKDFDLEWEGNGKACSFSSLPRIEVAQAVPERVPQRGTFLRGARGEGSRRRCESARDPSRESARIAYAEGAWRDHHQGDDLTIDRRPERKEPR